MNLALKDEDNNKSNVNLNEDKERKLNKDLKINKPVNKSNDKKKEIKDIDYSKHASSYFFQAVLFYQEIYVYFYFALEVIIFIFKCNVLKYPTSAAGIEISCLVLIELVQLVRFYIGKKGNSTESSIFVLFFLILSFFTLFSNIYFGFLQTYSLKIEVIINGIGIAFNIIEIIGGVLAFGSLNANENSL